MRVISRRMLVGVVGLAISVAAASHAQPADGPNGTSIYESLQLRKPKAQPDPPQADEGSERRVIARGKRLAVLVGVGEAKVPGAELTPLPECINDATKLAEALTGAGYECATLTDHHKEEPTRANVLAAVRRVCDRAGEQDQVLLYFSTHGGAPTGEPMLAMRDGTIALKEIKGALAGSKALVKLVFLDACRSENGFRTESSEFRDVHVVLSCRPDESSNTGLRGLSVFTEILIESFQDCAADRVKDGRLELDEVLYYLDQHVAERVREYFPTEKQNPTRTVVDPRAINPILAECRNDSIYRSLLLEEAPIATDGPVKPAMRNDMILTAKLAGKVGLGMSREELESNLGEPFLGFTEPEFTNTGKDIVGFRNLPNEGDILWVTFEDHRVSSILLMGKGPCVGNYDLERARAGFEALRGGRTVDEVAPDVVGQPIQTIFDRFGCPSGGLIGIMSVESSSGTATWDNVPGPGRLVRVGFKDGLVREIVIEGMK